jgi:DNA-binding SARP family transcriptional activator
MRMRATLRDEKLRVALASGAAMSYEQAAAIARDSARRMMGTGTSTGDAALTVRALGPLQIVLEGAELNGVSSAGRSRELLVYLLTQPSGATKEQIGAALWPDVDAAKLRNNFHVAMHRLRKILGASEWVVAQGDRYSIDRSRGVAFDGETFERDVKTAMRLLGTHSEAPSRLARTLEVYRGDFLAGVSAGEWADEIRERLRHLYAAALSALGRALMDRGDASGAADVYEKLVAFDIVDEEATRGLMLALAKQGDRAGASRAYKRLAESLRRQLDTQPEPRTVKLHEEIRKSDA